MKKEETQTEVKYNLSGGLGNGKWIKTAYLQRSCIIQHNFWTIGPILAESSWCLIYKEDAMGLFLGQSFFPDSKKHHLTFVLFSSEGRGVYSIVNYYTRVIRIGIKSPRPLSAAFDRERFLITDKQTEILDCIQKLERQQTNRQTDGWTWPNVLSPLLCGR